MSVRKGGSPKKSPSKNQSGDKTIKSKRKRVKAIVDVDEYRRMSHDLILQSFARHVKGSNPRYFKYDVNGVMEFNVITFDVYPTHHTMIGNIVSDMVRLPEDNEYALDIARQLESSEQKGTVTKIKDTERTKMMGIPDSEIGRYYFLTFYQDKQEEMITNAI